MTTLTLSSKTVESGSGVFLGLPRPRLGDGVSSADVEVEVAEWPFARPLVFVCEVGWVSSESESDGDDLRVERRKVGVSTMFGKDVFL